jgi:hypothetical protein
MESFDEFCRDVRSEYVESLISDDPDKAKELFLAELDSQYREMVQKFLSQEDILDLAHSMFVDGDRDHVDNALMELLDSVQDSGKPREVIAEVTKDDLRALGVMKGTLWEEAPWRLIKMEPSDLPLEGTRMRHCVGDRGMGYIEALKSGEIELWSFRSRADKPRFTLEIDPLDEAGFADVRVLQLKGKANREAGFADRNATDIKFPEEVILWDHLLKQLGIDPLSVDDFSAYKIPSTRKMTGNTGSTRRSFSRPFTQPYRDVAPNPSRRVRAADLESIRGQGVRIRFRDEDGLEKEGRFRQLGRSRQPGMVLVKYQDDYAVVERTAYALDDTVIEIL